MKKLTLVALATLFALPAYANQTYIAAELGGGSYSMSGNASDNRILKELDVVGFLNIKLGQMLNENVRYYGYLQHGGDTTVTEKIDTPLGELKTKEANLTTYEAGLGGDYLHNFTNQFYAIAGANIGMYKSKLEVKILNFNTDYSNTGLSAGANLGLGYAFTDHFGMEIGYRHTHFFGNDFSDQGITVNFDASNMGYLNLNYKF
ncbi:outer membrane beta-barrel protein [Vibrio caribbeanicus]|uniref:outer membrane beta-barrel protein n=1 Tax=Vibrio caribbeanicus TaxID=701175 RepID=UPI002283A4B6|nr:outer membrane beta-barrel protein [Vibrio caribbeanicus]MCY9845363.1 outer membrane beta-barrel protein [Vibrio caribbeanicus]